jgi:hypothetical protein
MLVAILFFVFLVLWLASLLPGPASRLGYAGSVLPWICVALLGWATFRGAL